MFPCVSLGEKFVISSSVCYSPIAVTLLVWNIAIYHTCLCFTSQFDGKINSLSLTDSVQCRIEADGNLYNNRRKPCIHPLIGYRI